MKKLNLRISVIKAGISKFLKKFKLSNFVFLFFAGVINGFGVTFFLSPVSLYDSGISGTSMLLAQITPEYLTLSFFLLILNIPLFIYGLKKQGIVFTVNSIFVVTIYSITAWLISDVFPVDVSVTSPLAGEDLLLCALFGGVISGLGSGLAIRFGGAMDGIEVMAVIFSKRIGISVGTFVMIYNVLLYVTCGILSVSWILPLYSIIAYSAGLKTVDFIVEGLDRAKSAMIITVKPEQICSAVSAEFKCGVTTMQAKGYYAGSNRTVVYVVINRFQLGKLKALVHENDPSAYVTVSDVADVISANKTKN